MEKDNNITETRNRVFEGGLSIGRDNPIALKTAQNKIYRKTGFGQLSDIINTGYIRAKSKVKGGHEKELFWTKGGTVYYYDKTPILEVSSDTLSNDQMGALTIEDLTSIWIFDEYENKYINELNFIKATHKILSEEKKTITKEELIKAYINYESTKEKEDTNVISEGVQRS